MGVRTGKGDDGFSDLVFRKQMEKDSPDMCAIGDLDELNSYLGLIKVKIRGRKKKEMIERIQRAVYIIASEIAISSEKKKKAGHLLDVKETDWIKSVVYELESKMKIERRFYLPGNSEISAIMDIARAVTRRAERSVVRLFHGEAHKNWHILTYLNCVSDVLFVMAREKKRKLKSRLKPAKRRKK